MFGTDYWPDEYWADEYWPAYYNTAVISALTSLSLNPGYWPIDYFPRGYWAQSYWPGHGAAAPLVPTAEIGPSRFPRRNMLLEQLFREDEELIIIDV